MGEGNCDDSRGRMGPDGQRCHGRGSRRGRRVIQVAWGSAKGYCGKKRKSSDRLSAPERLSPQGVPKQLAKTF